MSDTTKRRPPGRPLGSKSKKGQRTIRTTITWHTDEMQAVEAAAKVAKVKSTRFVREAALRAAKGFNKKVCKTLALGLLIAISLLHN